MFRKLSVILLLVAAVTGPCLGAGPVKELRGAWVTSWSNGFLTPQEADATIQAAKDANLNALFIEVRKIGDAYYKSNYEPKAVNKDIYPPADYDPLAYIIEKAHAAGIEVHAWLVTFRVWKGTGEAPEGHVVKNHPDWLNIKSTGESKNSEGVYLDPGVPGVKDFTVNVFMDVVKNYDIDGIHFDYIRYPGKDWGYNPTSITRFNSEFNRTGKPDPKDPQWCQWRRDQVTEVVRRVYRETNAIKPRVKVTASTIPWGDCPEDFKEASPYTVVYQDWQSWMKEGILDANVPMNYKDEANAKNAAQYRRWLDGFTRWKYGRHVYAGQEFYVPEKAVAQIKATRSKNLEGSCGFAFNSGSKRDALVKALRAEVFQDPALIPEMPWKLDAAKKASRENYNKAIYYATKGKNLDKAIELLKASIKDDPGYVDAHFRLGRCYLRKEMDTEASAKFQEVLKMDPKYTAAEKELQKMAKSKQRSSLSIAKA
jgi:uncharacterized lipoprotein YddW (UPF0748 family)